MSTPALLALALVGLVLWRRRQGTSEGGASGAPPRVSGGSTSSGPRSRPSTATPAPSWWEDIPGGLPRATWAEMVEDYPEAVAYLDARGGGDKYGDLMRAMQACYGMYLPDKPTKNWFLEFCLGTDWRLDLQWLKNWLGIEGEGEEDGFTAEDILQAYEAYSGQDTDS